MCVDLPLDEDEHDRWRTEADRALEAARVQQGVRLYNWACVAAEQASQLARHYIPSRYPDAHASGTVAEHYGASDASSAIEDVQLELAFADRVWRELHA